MRVPYVLLCLIVVVATCSSLSRVFAIHATDAWLSDAAVKAIEKHEYLTSEEFETFWQSHMGVHAYQSCENKIIQLAPGIDYVDCWYVSSAGEHSAYGNFLKPQGEEYAGLVGVDAQTRIIPIHQDQGFIELKPSVDGGFTVGLRTLGNTELQVLADYDGIQAYGFTGEPDLLLRDQGGNAWLVDENLLAINVWFSENGRFMLMANQGTGELVRVNLDTFQVATTLYPTESDGSDTFGTFSVTNDGRQVVVNIFGHQPRIIHFTDCPISEHTYVAAAVSCPMRELGDVISGIAPDTFGLGNFAMFTSNHTIDFYTSGPWSGYEYEVFTLYAPGTYQPGSDYLALGDSYASGEGARRYYAGTDRTENECHLSKVSYPFLIGSRLGLDSTHSVACSGAKIQNIIGPEHVDNELKDPRRSNQYRTDVNDIELGDYLPGQKTQNEFMIESPDIVTISIFGNDANFASYLEECTKVHKPGDTCFDTDAARWSLINNINKQFDRLVDTYTQLRRSTGPGGRTYVIGYPEFITSGSSCGNNVRLNAAEVDLTLKLSRYLNFVIQRAAVKAGVVYVDTSSALNGHKLCEPGSPKAVHGATLSAIGGSARNTTFRESFHPTDYGHVLLESSILNGTNNFTLNNPRPQRHLDLEPDVNDAVNFGIISDSGVADAHDTLLQYLEPDWWDSVVVRGSAFEDEIGGAGHGLESNADFMTELRSDPISLGTFRTDESGTLRFSVQIPEDIEPGFHRLSLYGPNTDGEQIELRYLLYIAASEDDWDGNGIPNSQQKCLIQLADEGSGEMVDDWCDNATVFGSDSPIANPAAPYPVRLANSPAGGSATITVDDSRFPAGQSPTPMDTSDPARPPDRGESSQDEEYPKTLIKQMLLAMAVLVFIVAGLLLYGYTRNEKS